MPQSNQPLQLTSMDPAIALLPQAVHRVDSAAELGRYIVRM
ncbi:MAG: hypothetical protein AAGL69_07170 [Pseudomonadota bacterium]